MLKPCGVLLHLLLARLVHQCSSLVLHNSFSVGERELAMRIGSGMQPIAAQCLGVQLLCVYRNPTLLRFTSAAFELLAISCKLLSLVHERQFRVAQTLTFVLPVKRSPRPASVAAFSMSTGPSPSAVLNLRLRVATALPTGPRPGVLRRPGRPGLAGEAPTLAKLRALTALPDFGPATRDHLIDPPPPRERPERQTDIALHPPRDAPNDGRRRGRSSPGRPG